MAKTNPAQFMRQVRNEASKVAWPTRKETGVATVMVLVMAVISAIFFLLVDQLAGYGIGMILGIGV